MNIYHRNTNLQFIILWAFFLLLFTLMIVFIVKKMLLGLLITGCLVFLSGTVRIHGLTITQDLILVRRYTRFGLKRIDIEISPVNLAEAELWEHGNLDGTNSTDTWLDIFFIPAIFFSGKKGLTIKKMPPGSGIKSLRLYLSDKEYSLIKNIN